MRATPSTIAKGFLFVLATVVTVWFMAALGGYWFLSSMFSKAPALLNQRPVLRELPAAPPVVPKLTLFGMRIFLPFNVHDFTSVRPVFNEDRLTGLTMEIALDKDNKGSLSIITSRPNAQPPQGQQEDFGDMLEAESLKQAMYSTLDDYNWLDLRRNMQLAERLGQKLVWIEAGGEAAFYEIKAAGYETFFLERRSRSDAALVQQQGWIKIGPDTYMVRLLGQGEQFFQRMEMVLGSIEQQTEFDKAYKETSEALQQRMPAYPPDLTMLSLVSMGKHQGTDMAELRRLTKDAPGSLQGLVHDNLKGRIDELRGQRIKKDSKKRPSELRK